MNARRPPSSLSPALPEPVLEGRSVEDGRPVRVTVRDGRSRRSSATASIPATPGSPWAGATSRSTGTPGTTPTRQGRAGAVVGAMVRALWPEGVTGSCITICTESPARMLEGIGAIAATCREDPQAAASIIGIHVEGPHIASEDGPRGRASAPPHPAARPRGVPALAGGGRRTPPDDHGLARVRRAPSTTSGRSSPTGCVASIGHTTATSDQIRAAVDAGATWSTHLGNGAHALIKRHPNYIWDQLAEDRLSAGFIFDGHHLPPAVMRTFVRAKGIERSVLVSDALLDRRACRPGTTGCSTGREVTLQPSGRLELDGHAVPRGRRDRDPGLPRECRPARGRHARGRRPDGHRQPVTAARPAHVGGPREPASRRGREPHPVPPRRRGGRRRRSSARCSAARVVYEAPGA